MNTHSPIITGLSVIALVGALGVAQAASGPNPGYNPEGVAGTALRLGAGAQTGQPAAKTREQERLRVNQNPDAAGADKRMEYRYQERHENRQTPFGGGSGSMQGRGRR
ncbi:MAG: hypothetical protein H6955_05135 [Chromatiaceae bacterium]|nr:hypothetical protein [Gammaproteobacteria bacterium]MCP5312916.1 hypothetical protein [Chromatiaceae bacterium]